MRDLFAKKHTVGSWVLALAAPIGLMARDGDQRSWDNLQRLAAGQQISIAKTKGEPVQGTFVSFNDQTITVSSGKHDSTVERMDVSRVKILAVHSRRNLWIGAGLGAGGGAAIGAALGEGLANRSGGDFSNLKPAIIGASAGAGALAGALIGSTIGNRGTTIYRSK